MTKQTTQKQYLVVYPGKESGYPGHIEKTTRTREEAREHRVPFQHKIMQVEYRVAKNGTIEIVNQKQVR
jgi:hypothetical protein